MDFSDLPVLGARDGVERELRTRVVEVVRDYTRTFFDKYLRGMTTPLLDEKNTNPLVDTAKWFPPAKPNSF
jgi:hypothetical protein